MVHSDPKLDPACEAVAERVRRELAQRNGSLIVAIDGASGAGKSTLADRLARELHATVVRSDEFFSAEITDAQWNARSPAERAADAIDWRRMRMQVLEPLLARRAASYFPFNFASGVRADGSYSMSKTAIELAPSDVILVEGAYSSRPELADLIALSVLVEAPSEVRRARLANREAPDFLAAWHARWDAAEAHYFDVVRPRASFDLVVAL